MEHRLLTAFHRWAEQAASGTLPLWVLFRMVGVSALSCPTRDPVLWESGVGVFLSSL